jgi:hypothetical protein
LQRDRRWWYACELNDSIGMMKGENAMSWNLAWTDRMSDLLRQTLKVCVFIDVFLLAIFSVWFSLKFLWYFASYVNRTLFEQPW